MPRIVLAQASARAYIHAELHMAGMSNRPPMTLCRKSTLSMIKLCSFTVLLQDRRRTWSVARQAALPKLPITIADIMTKVTCPSCAAEYMKQKLDPEGDYVE